VVRRKFTIDKIIYSVVFEKNTPTIVNFARGIYPGLSGDDN